MLPLLVSALLAVASPAPCPGTTTIEVDACLSARFDAADTDLNRYYSVALKRVRKDVAKALTQSQRSWLSYRDAECGAVFQKFRDGTIRTSMELTCRTQLTRLRTYMIWANWLTYPDSTPSTLPRPAIDDFLSGGRG